MSASVRYLDTAGDVREGVVWSPGPLLASLWVLPRSGAPSSEAVVVRVPRKPGEDYREEAWDFEAHVVAKRGVKTWYGGEKVLPGINYERAIRAEMAEMSRAPRMSPKWWRAATEPTEVTDPQLPLEMSAA